MRINTLRGALLSALALALLFPSTAAARHTTLIETYEINTSNLVCAGTVLQTVTGRIQSIARFDSADDLLSVANVYPNYKVTYSNPLTGASVTSVRGAMERRSLDADGGYVRMTAGLFGEIILPGQGVIAMNTGLLTVTFDAYGDVVSVEMTPTRDGPVANYICPYLT